MEICRSPLKGGRGDVNPRVISLLDMDCFECQIYQLDKPETVGKPCVAANGTGRIVSVNYEARKFGIGRSLRVPEAKQKCPKLKVLTIPEHLGKPDNRKLRAASWKVYDVIDNFIQEHGHGIVLEFSPNDEFYLDLTEEVSFQKLKVPRLWLEFKYYSKTLFMLALYLLIAISVDIAKKLGPGSSFSNKEIITSVVTLVSIFTVITIKKQRDKTKINIDLDLAKSFMKKVCQEVKSQSKMTASAGVSTNKFRAKLASSEDKPNGITTLPPERFDTVILSKDIDQISGLKGHLGQKVMEKLNVKKMEQLKDIPRGEFIQTFGFEDGNKVYNILKGIDRSDVIAKEYSKGVGCRKTFPPPRPGPVAGINNATQFFGVKIIILVIISVMSFVLSSVPAAILITLSTFVLGLGLEKGVVVWRTQFGDQKLKKCLEQRSLEMFERLREERKAHFRETTVIALTVTYLTNRNDPESKVSLRRTFPLEEAKGYRELTNKAFSILTKCEEFDRDKMWITELGFHAKQWRDIIKSESDRINKEQEQQKESSWLFKIGRQIKLCIMLVFRIAYFPISLLIKTVKIAFKFITWVHTMWRRWRINRLFKGIWGFIRVISPWPNEPKNRGKSRNKYEYSRYPENINSNRSVQTDKWNDFNKLIMVVVGLYVMIYS